MNYRFVEKTREAQRERGTAELEKEAFNSIIDALFKRNLRGNDKITGLGEYDGESLFGTATLFPGCIYAFKYRAMKPGTYSDGTVSFEWTDGLPVVLVTRVAGERVSGINLNMCDMAVRTHVINLLHNLDPDFYDNGGDVEMYRQGKRPISNSVAKVFLNKNTENAFYEAVKRECRLTYTGFIYRTYNVSRISNPRLIETWQHRHIPFLKYTGELKGDILRQIWRISGIKNAPI